MFLRHQSRFLAAGRITFQFLSFRLFSTPLNSKPAALDSRGDTIPNQDNKLLAESATDTSAKSGTSPQCTGAVTQLTGLAGELLL